jgi:hypothetical protein
MAPPTKFLVNSFLKTYIGRKFMKEFGRVAASILWPTRFCDNQPGGFHDVNYS